VQHFKQQLSNFNLLLFFDSFKNENQVKDFAVFEIELFFLV